VIFEIIASIVCGLVAHQTRLVTYKMPNGWRNLVEHVIGVTAAYPSFLLFKRKLNGQGAEAAYWLAYLGVGMGVALGWLIDTIQERATE